MEILLESKNILEKAGYTVYSDVSSNSLLFEDDTILGQICILEKIEIIISEWEKFQESFLRKNAQNLFEDTTKTWNAYSVFLTSDTVNLNTRNSVFDIEENLVGTRKIVGYGIEVKADIEHFLLPILPIQKNVSIHQEDIVLKLKDRVEIEELLDDFETVDILNRLLSSDETK